MKIFYLTPPGELLLSGVMRSPACEQTNRPVNDNGVRTAYEDGIPTASIEVYGDKWCVFGNCGVSNLVDDSLFFSESQDFGFPMPKKKLEIELG